MIERWENEVHLMNAMRHVLMSEQTGTRKLTDGISLDIIHGTDRRVVRLFDIRAESIARITTGMEPAGFVFCDPTGLYISTDQHDMQIRRYLSDDLNTNASELLDPILDWNYISDGDMTDKVFQLETIHDMVAIDSIVLYSHFNKYIKNDATSYSRTYLWEDIVEFDYQEIIQEMIK